MARAKTNFRTLNDAFQEDLTSAEGDGYAKIDAQFKSTIDACDAAINDMDEQTEELYKPVAVSMGEVNDLLGEIKQGYDESKLTQLLEDCQGRVLETLIRPFGLGKILFEDERGFDGKPKFGGNVTTLRNAKDNVFASKQDQERYKREYGSTVYHNGNAQYLAAKSKLQDTARDGDLKDVYTDRKLEEKVIAINSNGEARERAGYDVEHVVSAKEIHDRDDTKLFMTEGMSAAVANSEENLGAANSSLNRSKSENSFEEWASKKCSSDPSKTNAEAYGVNMEKAREADNQARAAIDKEIRSARNQYYVKNLTQTGAAEAGRMGLQQALGLMLEEFVRATFAEVVDVWKNGFKGQVDDVFFSTLTARLKRIAKRVVSRWRDAVTAFKDGAIVGFFSNIITVVINMFKTTIGRFGRMIREGIMSFFRAIKLLICPPEGMSRREALHEASKVLTTGLIIAGGIAVEEVVEKAILTALPLLAPFAPMISPVLVGLATGLASAFAVFMLDRADFFGVEKDGEHGYIVSKLTEMIDDDYSSTLEVTILFPLPEFSHGA